MEIPTLLHLHTFLRRRARVSRQTARSSLNINLFEYGNAGNQILKLFVMEGQVCRRGRGRTRGGEEAKKGRIKGGKEGIPAELRLFPSASALFLVPIR